uniref:Gag-Pol polyprotein n=1 Tax=Tanacetum cinerariifolium TaxID=118510 RepID=A0A699HME6_TANCI|nr:Gag-Pol polyprotein [Tanacetum cinerariifolium]
MDGNAIANLYLTLADGVLSSMEEKKSAKEIWDHLARLYEARTLHNKNFLKRKLYALRMTKSTSVTEHVNNLNTIFSQLTSLSCIIEPKELFDDVAVAILEKENRRNNREDRQTSSRHVEALVVKRGRSMELGSSGSHNHEDGNALCCEASITNEIRKRFTDVWLFDTGATSHMTATREWFHEYKPISGGGFVYSCNDHELKIIGIGSIMVKMHDDTVEIQNKIMKIIKGALVIMRGKKLAANLYQLKGKIIEEAKASVASHSPSNKVVVTWHLKLGHMSEQGMKIIVERKLLPGLIKEQSTLYPSLMTIPGDVGCTQSRRKRMNRTLLQRARAMLETTSLGKSFWAKAVNTACYVINHSPSTAVELKTPMEVWTGKQVNYSDLHIFRSLMYYEVNETNEFQTPATRTLNCERRHPGWHSDYVIENNVAYCLLIEEGEPSTLQEALNNLDASFWKEAMQEEIEALYKNKTWELVPLLGGYAQKEGIDFNEIFSPVVRMTTIQVVLVICATYDLHLEQLDVKTAFFYGNLEEEIYMLQPEGNHDGSKSTIGYVFTLSGGTVSWVSKRQSVVAMSTMEEEYVTAAQASKEAVWLKMLLEEIGHKQEKITLFCDNQSALYLARNPAFHSKTKHIRVQYHFIRKKVKEGIVDMHKIYTDDNVADYLMKAINCDKFIWCRSACGLAKT